MFFYERRKKKDIKVVLPFYDIKKQQNEGVSIKATILTLVKDDREINNSIKLLDKLLK